MIKLVIFDLDGVLVDSKDLHYQALNMAIADVNKDWVISYEDHLANYNGNPTSVKLRKLSEKYSAIKDVDLIEISAKKQEYTKELIDKINLDEDLVKIFEWLTANCYLIAVASNSIRNTLGIVLEKLGVMPLVNIALSSEDVSSPKPDPEIYWRCMSRARVTPLETIILEDSEIGHEGALASGAKLVRVGSRKDVTIELIKEVLDSVTS